MNYGNHCVFLRKNGLICNVLISGFEIYVVFNGVYFHGDFLFRLIAGAYILYMQIKLKQQHASFFTTS